MSYAEREKHQRSENDSRLQLNLMDYVARQNNNTYGRFTSMDPLAEKYLSWSPYAYCANNPLRFIDPDGMDVYILHNGRLIRIPVEDSTNDYILFSNIETNRIDILTVNDQSILKNFTSGEPSHAITSNADDAFNVFKFMADNTPNEWGLDGNKDGTYTLRTDYKKGDVNPHGKKYLIGLSFQFFKNN